METSDHPSLSMSEALRDLAQQMCSVARNFPDHAEKQLKLSNSIQVKSGISSSSLGTDFDL